MLNFIIATSIVCLIPGPSIFLVIMNTLQNGLFSGGKTILGILAADVILMVLTLMGIGTILYSSALAFTTVKWLGAVYLIYLGISQLKSKTMQFEQATPSTSKHPFVQGLGITLLNPKLVGFFIVFFPQFIDRVKPIQEQLLILGPVFLLIALGIMALYALIAEYIRQYVRSPKGAEFIKRASGFSLISCGVFSATMSRS